MAKDTLQNIETLEISRYYDLDVTTTNNYFLLIGFDKMLAIGQAITNEAKRKVLQTKLYSCRARVS